MMQVLSLTALSKLEDVSLLALRLLVGGFLMWGVADNLFDAARMSEFVEFLKAFNFPAPVAMAWLTCVAQFVCGALFVVGLLTRWAGLVMVVNFIVAMVMVHLGDDFRAQFPALILIAIGAHFAVRGAGRLSVDGLIFGQGRVDRA